MASFRTQLYVHSTLLSGVIQLFSSKAINREVEVYGFSGTPFSSHPLLADLVLVETPECLVSVNDPFHSVCITSCLSVFLGANHLDDQPFMVMPYMPNGNAVGFRAENPEYPPLYIVRIYRSLWRPRPINSTSSEMPRSA
jgi:hypothetical protein